MALTRHQLVAASAALLWVNLPRSRKLIPPRYQDIAPERIPETDLEGAHVRVVCCLRADRWASRSHAADPS
jgi:redox-sensitive bicupin YhaK (pirin superfamily)